MKKFKTDFFFQKLLFSASIKKLKIDFFEILIIFNNLSKYVKNDFFSEKNNFLGKIILSKHTLNHYVRQLTCIVEQLLCQHVEREYLKGFLHKI